MLALGACAHTPDLPLRPDPSPPPGSTTEVFAARDGTQLLLRRWPSTDDARAALVIVHGLKDYSARYASLASRAAAAGFDVYAFDLRGHGRSAGPRVAPAEWTDYVDDLDRMLRAVEAREAGKPVFMLGHSMGGAIATRAAEIHTPKIAGLVLSGPALAVDAPPLLIAATRLTAWLTPGVGALSLDDRAFSSDPASAAAIARDPLISDGAAPARTAAGLIEGMRAVWSWHDLRALTMPILAMHGTADRLTAPAGSRALIAYAPSRDKTLRIYDGYFHDLLHEPGGRGQQVEDDVLGWLTARASGAEPTPAPAVYAGHLDGDPHGWAQAVDIAGGASDTGTGVHAGARLTMELARGAPLGLQGSLVAQLLDARWAVAVRPIGVAVRLGGFVFSAAGGGALVTGTTLTWAAGGRVDAPLAPFSPSLFFDYTYRGLGGTDVGATVRFGGTRFYWPRALAGVGPAVTVGAQTAPGSGWFALVGLQLYGAD